MTFPYSEQNTTSRRRMETLVYGLSDEDLARTTDYGWTVAALLAHLAFWDQRMSVIL
ncbi:MAG: maleylpyruvate isomerase N-terminal domain-containing protein, partial [Bacteroidota bacterium]